MVLSCVASVLACPLSVMGMKCTCFARGSSLKSLLALCGAISFLCAGVLCLATVAWTTRDIMMDFYNPFSNGMKYEMGLAVYLGYASAFLSLMGGLLLCWSSRSDRSHSSVHRQMNTLSSPPPAFNHIYPPYKPPEALRDNHAPSRYSICRSGYKLDDYF